jgi:chaperonin GroES
MYKPSGNNVLVKPDNKADKTDGGIFLPETSIGKPIKGVIAAMGPGMITDGGKRRTPAVSVGDTVVFYPYAGTAIKVDGETYSIMKENDLLGVVI